MSAEQAIFGKARWISFPYQAPDLVTGVLANGVPAPHFRRSFWLEKKVARAQVKLCGLGYYELTINGNRIGDSVLQPPFTRYDRTVLYDTFEIAGFLAPGENVIGVILGNGMYNQFAVNPWHFEKAPWRHHPKMICTARMLADDGQETTLDSDASWKTAFGPIKSDNLYEGEIYDARDELPGWNQPGYNDQPWQPAVICRAPGGLARPMAMEPCRVLRRIEPVACWEARPGIWIYDLGLNMTGWAAIRAAGPAGTEISLRFAEKLTPERDIDPSNINIFADAARFQKDIYILKGQGVETWEPRFTYHGFQYVQVSGYPGTPQLDSLTGCLVHTDLPDRGSFSCSNDLLNKIQAAARLSTLGNYCGMPTDCPHREKNGWTGDAALSAEQVLLNFQPDRGYRKWLQDMVDCQRPNGQLPGIVPTGGWGYNWGSGPAWDMVLVLLPWYLYVYRGDQTVLAEYYEPMKRYVDSIETMAAGHIVGYSLGDWCPPAVAPSDFDCPLELSDTAIYAMLCRLMAAIARVLGQSADAIRYASLGDAVADAFNQAFVNAATGEIASGCQTAYASTLYAGLVTGSARDRVIERLVQEVERCDRHIDCGILGTKYIMQVLVDIGRADLAYAIATQTTFPGWGHWIEQGATTLWENWRGDNSRNHHMFSDISAWFYKCLAGISPDPAEPGFRHIMVKPNPLPQLAWVKASHESPWGVIRCDWENKPDRTFQLELAVPAGCHATLYLPGADDGPILEHGQPITGRQDVQLIGREDDRRLLAVQAGSYVFSVQKVLNGLNKLN